MGWAKYTEDNIEIYLNRQYMHGEWGSESPNNTARTDWSFFENISIRLHSKSDFKPVDRNGYPEDKYLFCRECKKMFIFPVASQRYYASKGWVEPKRCKSCRKQKNVA